MSNDRRTILMPTAGTTGLATDFPVLDETDLVVIRTRASVALILTLEVDYTVSGVGNDGGAFVTLASASLLGDTYTLDGNSQADRISDYDPEQTPSGDQLDADLNRLVHLAQEAKRDLTDLKANAGLAPQIELSVQGGNIAWRPVGTVTWNVLAGLSYPAHSHVINDVTGLQAVLDAKLTAALLSAAGLAFVGLASAALQRASMGVTTGIRGHARNLKTANGVTNPTFEMTATADELVLKNAGGDAVLLSNVNVTGAISTSGANGLDTGAEAASTWYYVHVIYNGASAALLFSLSATAPTLPGGYTHSALVGAVYNDGSSNFRTIRGIGKRFFQGELEALTGATAGVTTWTALSLAAFVPPIATHCYGRTAIASNAGLGVRVAADSAGAIFVQDVHIIAGAYTLQDGYYSGFQFQLPILTAQTIYRKHNAVTAGAIIILNGFELPLGD